MIAAEGEQKASGALKDAAEVIQQSPHALQVDNISTVWPCEISDSSDRAQHPSKRVTYFDNLIKRYYKFFHKIVFILLYTNSINFSSVTCKPSTLYRPSITPPFSSQCPWRSQPCPDLQIKQGIFIRTYRYCRDLVSLNSLLNKIYKFSCCKCCV